MPNKKMAKNKLNMGMSDDIPVNDAMNRNTNMGMDEYMGGGMTKINPMGYRKGGEVKMPMYKEGGETQDLTEENIQLMKDAMAKRKFKMKHGGKTHKAVNAAKNPGLAKLPEDVRNKMGYMQRGGKAEKDDEATAKSMRKTSIYMAGPKEKGPAGGVVKGVKRNKRTIGKKKRETMKSKAAKMNLKEIKESRSKRVRTVKKYETGQGPTYKGGKGFKPRKRKKYAMGGRAAGNRVMTENAVGQIEGKVYKK